MGGRGSAHQRTDTGAVGSFLNIPSANFPHKANYKIKIAFGTAEPWGSLQKRVKEVVNFILMALKYVDGGAALRPSLTNPGCKRMQILQKLPILGTRLMTSPGDTCDQAGGEKSRWPLALAGHFL
jgi:hypothetical protein